MKTWVHRLGSMKIAIGLLVLILMALAAGTIVESISGTETAGRTVYDAFWFRLLLAAFALNVACALVDLWPWGRARLGFVVTHGSMLLILVGALVTLLFKSEGQLALWEGEEGATFQETTRTGPPEHPRTLTLPFSVRLDAFEIDTYPGTERPAMFRSRVTVSDPRLGRTFPAVIEMNRELSYGGFRLFQSGYQRTKERDQTVLLVSRDPGEPIVFTGYGLLLAGMLVVLATRIAQQRADQPAHPTRAAAAARRAAALLAGALLAPALARPAAAAPAGAPGPDAATVERLRRLPVQHDGRVMPLDTVAREAVRQVTGSVAWRGLDPVAVVLGWAFDPERSAAEPLVRLGPGLPASIGLPDATARASFRDLARNQALLSLFERARAEAERERPLGGSLREVQRLEERLVAMQGFLQGDVFRVIPDPSNPNAAWGAPERVREAADLAPYLAADRERAMDREVLYNRVRPSRLAWWILAPAAVVSVLAWSGRRRFDLLAILGLAGGFAVMTWGIAMRWAVAGRIPASNMYESLLFLGWGVGLFAIAALVILRNRLVVLNATAMAALTMALADLLPLDPFIHPMPPVLSGTPWLAIHVPIIMLSYSVLALGVVVAHMQIGVLIVAPARREIAFRMNDLLYWYLHVGSILLVAGILTGSIWAASSWGRYWGWDPKEVWSLVAFLAYLAILHGRFDRLIGPFGVAALSIVAFWAILMTYVGVNFVLTAGLHSYGFGGSGVVRWFLIVAGAEALFLALGYFSQAAGRPADRRAKA
jgi:ABC-type transport system involved in cytochrome c biogenesis permease subunit